MNPEAYDQTTSWNQSLLIEPKKAPNGNPITSKDSSFSLHRGALKKRKPSTRTERAASKLFLWSFSDLI